MNNRLNDKSEPKTKPKFGQRRIDPISHKLWEDILGILASVLLVALAIGLFQKLGLITSGIAGLAIVLHYATGWQTGLVFFLLNLPFYYIAVTRLGWVFALKTFGAVALLSVLVDLQSNLIVFESINPIFGALAGGVMIGFGLLGVFRHRASLGGFGILSVWLQDRFGIRAGLSMLALDIGTFCFAMFVAPWEMVAFSLFGAVVLNIFLAINHRPDRYIAK